MEIIKKIREDFITDNGILLMIPYTSSIFVFDRNGLINANSKYYKDTILKECAELPVSEHDEQLENYPINVSYRHLLLKPKEYYLMLIDGACYELYIVNSHNIALSYCKGLNVSQDKNIKEELAFSKLLDKESIAGSDYLYISHTVNSFNDSDSNELRLINHKDKTNPILIRCNGKYIKASSININILNNDEIEYTLNDIPMEDIDYDKVFNFIENDTQISPPTKKYS